MGEAILVLEDNPIAYGVVESILGLTGYRVLKASNEAAALALVIKHNGPIRLLIADATLAGRNRKRMVLSLQ